MSHGEVKTYTHRSTNYWNKVCKKNELTLKASVHLPDSCIVGPTLCLSSEWFITRRDYFNTAQSGSTSRVTAVSTFNSAKRDKTTHQVRLETRRKASITTRTTIRHGRNISVRTNCPGSRPKTQNNEKENRKKNEIEWGKEAPSKCRSVWHNHVKKVNLTGNGKEKVKKSWSGYEEEENNVIIRRSRRKIRKSTGTSGKSIET